VCGGVSAWRAQARKSLIDKELVRYRESTDHSQVVRVAS
jgi:hypothetical protein